MSRFASPLRKLVSLAAAFVMLFVSTFTFSISVFAAVPNTLNYQSRLRDAGGDAVNAATTVSFSLYDSLAAGVTLWTETYDQAAGACTQVTPDADGYFAIALGSCSPFPSSLNFTDEVFLGVSIGADPEASPRVLIGAHPYARNSHRVGDFVAAAVGLLKGESTGVADALNLAFDSAVLAFEGSAWDGVAALALNMKLQNTIIDSTNYKLSVMNNVDAEVFSVDESGNTILTGALTVENAADMTAVSLLKTTAGRWLGMNDGTDDFGLYNSAGTPEGAVVADIGSISMDTTNGDVYIKTTDAVNTGWLALAKSTDGVWQKIANSVSANNLSPIDPTINTVTLENNTAGQLTMNRLVHTDDASNYAAAVFEVKGSGPDFTNNMYFGKYGDSFWVPDWAGKGVMATDQDLVIGSMGTADATNPNADPEITFQVGGGYTTPNNIATLNAAGWAFDTGVRILEFLDEDDFISNSDVALATQQSIKAYVDSKVGTSIFDGDGDTGIQVEANPDEDMVKLSTAGTERFLIDDQGRMRLDDNPAATNRDSLFEVGHGSESSTFAVQANPAYGNIATFRDQDGENVFKANGSMSNNDLHVSFGDIDDAFGGVSFDINHADSAVNIESGSLRLLQDHNGGTNAVGFKSPNGVVAEQIWTLPGADGAANDALITDGAGNLSFGAFPANVTASNGLTRVGNDIQLGGTLAGNTYIEHGGADLIIREFAGEPETLFAGDNFKIQDVANNREIRFGTGGINNTGMTLEGVNEHNLYYRDDAIDVSSNLPTFGGMQYNADYSANFVDRTLVDKGYVDGAIVAGANNIYNTDGVLTSARTLDANGFGFNIVNNAITYEINDDASAIIADSGASRSRFDIEPNFFQMYAQNNGTFAASTISGNDSGNLSFSANNTGGLGDQMRVEMGTDKFNFTTGNTTFQGATYDKDYSANFVDRTLVDKGYVDSTVAAGNIYGADGILTGDRTITSNGNLLYFTGDTGNQILFEANDAPDRSYFAINPDEMEFRTEMGAAWSSMVYNSGGAYLGHSNGVGTTNIFIGDQMQVSDGINSRGFVNSGDYEANFVDRSLVTKQYVDGQVLDASPWTRDDINGYMFEDNLTDKIGLGTNVPTAKLDVFGDLKVRSANNTYIDMDITAEDMPVLRFGDLEDLGNGGKFIIDVQEEEFIFENAVLYVNNSSAMPVLQVNNNQPNTAAITRFTNTAGDFDMFRVDATPETSIVGSVGDLALDSTNGELYIKRTGDVTNTGWDNFVVSANAENIYSADGALASNRAVDFNNFNMDYNVTNGNSYNVNMGQDSAIYMGGSMGFGNPNVDLSLELGATYGWQGSSVMGSNGNNSAQYEVYADGTDQFVSFGAFDGALSGDVKLTEDGFSYAADYAGRNLVNDRWLVDKGYVDGKVGVFESKDADTLMGEAANVNQYNRSFVMGSPQMDDDGDAAHDTRFIFDKTTGAFRSGTVNGTEWDAASRGDNSFASGYNNRISGTNSFAVGQYNTTASSNVFLTGDHNTATRNSSTVIGRYNNASGNNSTAIGSYVNVHDYGEVGFGINSLQGTGNAMGLADTNQIFHIGNGTNSTSRSNAMTVLFGGEVGLGTVTPSTTLHVDSNDANTVAVSTFQNTAGDFQVFRSDATPEGAIIGSIGDIAVDSTNGEMYIKNSGNATNTGWDKLASSGSADNIYTTDGVLTSSRTVDGNNNEFYVENASIVGFETAAGDSIQIDGSINLNSQNGTQVDVSDNILMTTLDNSNFRMGPGGNSFTDGRIGAAQTGLEYGADYSLNYVARSLVDKGYVDTIMTAAAGSGLSWNAINEVIDLGGLLTQATDILMDTNGATPFTITDSSGAANGQIEFFATNGSPVSPSGTLSDDFVTGIQFNNNAFGAGGTIGISEGPDLTIESNQGVVINSDSMIQMQSSGLSFENSDTNSVLFRNNAGDIIFDTNTGGIMFNTPTVGTTATVGQILTLQDAITGEVEFADASSLVDNIYTADGTLTGDRTLTGNGLVVKYLDTEYSMVTASGTESTKHFQNEGTILFEARDTATNKLSQVQSHLGGISFSSNSTGALNEHTEMNLNSGGLVISNGVPGTFVGATYDVDYSANYVPRSLVDKEYVDGAVSAVAPTWQDTIDNQVAGNYIYVTTPSGEIEDDGANLNLQSKIGKEISLGAPNVLKMTFSNQNSTAKISDVRAVGSRTGLEYAADYSADYSPRSLVDKQYVDSHVSTSVFDADMDTGIQVDDGLDNDEILMMANGQSVFQIENNGNKTIRFGDWEEDGNGTKLEINDVGSYIGFNGLIAQFGDTEGNGNEVMFTVHDADKMITAYQSNFSVKPSSGAVDTGDFRMYQDPANGNGYVGFKSPSVLAGNQIWTLPNADGANGEILQTDGAGALSWGTATADNIYTADGSLTGNRIVDANGFEYLVSDGNSEIFLDSADVYIQAGNSYIDVSDGSVQYMVGDGVNQSGLNGSVDSFVVGGDKVSFRGLEYGADYSANNAANLRWLTDKEYVDSTVAAGNIYGTDGTLTGNRIVNANGHNLTFSGASNVSLASTSGIYSSAMDMLPDEMFYNVNDGTNSGDYGVTPSAVYFQTSNAGGALSLNIDSGSGMLFTDSINSKGVEYFADYSGNYSDRSLVDKGYVDGGLTSSAGNGLTWDAANEEFDLGGNLTSSTVLDAGFYQYRINANNSYSLFNQSNVANHINDGTDNTNWVQTSTTALLSGTGSFAGMEYQSDYSGNYSDRSLVDKEYVDGVVPDTLFVAGSGGVDSIVSVANSGLGDATTSTSMAVGLGTIASGSHSFTGGVYADASGQAAFNVSAGSAGSHSLAGADFSAILGGVNGQLTGTATNSVILGGSGLTGSASNTVYVPNLDVDGNIMLADMVAPAAVAGHSGLYSNAGELYALDAAGNSTLISPHDAETNEWIYNSKNVKSGDSLRIDMEAMMKSLDEMLGGGYVFVDGEAYHGAGDKDESVSDELKNVTVKMKSLDNMLKDLKAFMKKVVFNKLTVTGTAKFGGEVIFNKDTVGYAKVKAGKTEVEVKFAKKYSVLPVVTLTVMGLPINDLDYGVMDVEKSGFTVVIDKEYDADIQFSWHAFGGSNAKVPYSEVPSFEVVELDVVELEKVVMKENEEKEKLIEEDEDDDDDKADKDEDDDDDEPVKVEVRNFEAMSGDMLSGLDLSLLD